MNQACPHSNHYSFYNLIFGEQNTVYSYSLCSSLHRPLWYRLSPTQPALKHPQSILLPECEILRGTTAEKKTYCISNEMLLTTSTICSSLSLFCSTLLLSLSVTPSTVFAQGGNISLSVLLSWHCVKHTSK